MEFDRVPENEGKSKVLFGVLLAIGVVYILVSLYFIFDTRNQLAALNKDQQNSVEKLNEKVAATNRDLKASTETLAQQIGLKEQDLQTRMSARASELERMQKAAERRMAEETKAQMTQVSGEVAGVRTDLGTTKNDLAAAKTDLDATKSKLERMVGDLNVQGGLIAKTRDDLDELKHRGDRNIFEFTLQKGAHPTPVSTISLQLRKTDAKRNKFTLNVMADDKTIEKKDRNIAEPLQFYTGRDHQLYEVVVFTVNKNQITGYMATPKH